MTDAARPPVILRSEATKNPKPLCEYYVYILTIKARRLYVESENPVLIDLSTERSNGSGFFTAFRMTWARGGCHSEE